LPVALLVALVVARPAAANNHLIALDEVLASFQGDTSLQFIELRLLAPGQQSLSNGGGVRGAADLVFDDAAGSPAGQRVFTFTPENRSLQRVGASGVTAADWAGELQPTPQNNSGVGAILPTLCGDGAISQGEECDGDALGGASCASLGFASGALACQQCHFDTTPCSFCGNGVINGAEECDGTALGGRTCESLGFTGGALA